MKKPRKRVLPGLWKIGGSVQQIQHQRENNERKRDPLGHLRQRTVQRFRLSLGEEGLRTAGGRALGNQTSEMSGILPSNKKGPCLSWAPPIYSWNYILSD